MDSEKFLKWFKGKEDKELYLRTMILNIIILSSCLLIAYMIYNLSNVKQYSMLTNEISELGSIKRNPGYIAFSLGLIIAGIIFIPHALYFYRCLLPDIKFLSIISVFFLLTSSVGLALVGVFPTGLSHTMHLAAAIMAFGSLAMAMIFMVLPLLKKLIRKAEWPSIKILIICFTPPVFVFIFTGIVVGIPAYNAINSGTFSSFNPPAIWPLCEWVMMLSSLYCVFGIILTSKPEEI